MIVMKILPPVDNSQFALKALIKGPVDKAKAVDMAGKQGAELTVQSARNTHSLPSLAACRSPPVSV